MDWPDDLAAVTPALLRTLDALAVIARHFHPPLFAEVLAAVGEPDAALRAARPRLDAWPPDMARLAAPLAAAGDLALEAFDRLRAAGDLRDAFRALRGLSRAHEALWPLAAVLPPVSRHFLDADRRDDRALLARLAPAEPRADTGVFHFGGEPGARGGYSLFAPEDYSPDRSWPLVMALHGGSGNGRAFLWSWLAGARGRGAIVAAPTAVGETWALAGNDPDTPNLLRILEDIEGRWSIDPDRRLLTGMSDGGTFTYVSGLEAGSPFTHLAPIAASFHPMLAMMADPDRLRGLPIFVVHGALDWMFEVDMARQAQRSLSAAGAQVTYREIVDLSHTYPVEINAPILDWLSAAPARRDDPHARPL